MHEVNLSELQHLKINILQILSNFIFEEMLNTPTSETCMRVKVKVFYWLKKYDQIAIWVSKGF